MDTINKILSRPDDDPLHSGSPLAGPGGQSRRTPATLTDPQQTIINAKLTGSLAIEETGSDTVLTLQGQLEGDLTCDSISIVAAGSMDGTLTANYVTISGRYNGTVDSEHLTIKPGAVVRGQLRVRKSVVIEPNADFQGQLISVDQEVKQPLAPLPLKGARTDPVDIDEPADVPLDPAAGFAAVEEPLVPSQEVEAADLVPPEDSIVPPGLPAPEGEPDDLKRISGVGPKLEKLLNGLGIFHFHQIAAWTDENVAWVDDYLGFKGRIHREDWIGQAAGFAAGGAPVTH